MGLEQQLTDTLTQAIKAQDGRAADVVRMLKTRLMERRTAKGFTGVVDDALVLDVIGAYRKQLQKALAEYENRGERGAAQAAQLRFEVEFCERHLPKGLDEAALAFVILSGDKVFHAYREGGALGTAITEVCENRDGSLILAKVLCVGLSFLGYHLFVAADRRLGKGTLWRALWGRK